VLEHVPLGRLEFLQRALLLGFQLLAELDLSLDVARLLVDKGRDLGSDRGLNRAEPRRQVGGYLGRDL
jgi:hypothetical protein